MSVKIVFGAQHRLLQQLAADPGEVAVGVFEGPQYADGTTVADVAAWNHEGTATIPARPFLRIGLQSEAMQEYVQRAVKAVAEGRVTEDVALRALGEKGRAEVAKAISGRKVPPPNAPSTVFKKKSDVPLIDTGVLRSKIAYKVKT
jgi:hypothetical protein